MTAGSASLQADALDFFSDAVNYAVSLFVVGLALRYRAMAAFAKGATMYPLTEWLITRLNGVELSANSVTVPEAKGLL